MKKIKKGIVLSFCILLVACGNNETSTNDAPKDSEVAEEADQTTDPQIDRDVLETSESLQSEGFEGGDLSDIGWELMKNESFGALKIDMDTATVIGLIGPPTTKTPEEYWGADGGIHNDWSYPNLGLTLGMVVFEDTPEVAKQIFGMTLNDLGKFCTAKNICIGATAEEVKSAYKVELGNGVLEADYLVAGTVYGGLIFTFENNSLVEMFLGAAAE
ncbi:MAG: hypothetical protein GQ574_07515 [Crocinitomix sp.]|nr:hypothetical protein [Crocinitomix sp.]